VRYLYLALVPLLPLNFTILCIKIAMSVSHLTTSEIISKGDYLLPNFDPKTLKVAHLAGILVYHQIPVPSPHTKAKLIDIFNGVIKVNCKELRRQRIARHETPASAIGIVDVITGENVSLPQVSLL
jgi:hypothetical protein